MRTWLARAVSDGRQFAHFFTRTVAATIAVLSFASISALAQPAHEVGGEASLKLPDLSQVLFLGIDGHRLLMIGISVLHLRPGIRPHHLYPPAEDAGASFHARDFRADLRDLQNLPDHPGQIPADPLALHCRRHRALFRRAVPGAGEADCHHAPDHPSLQPGGNRGQLRCRLVRHSGQHLRQFAHCVCGPGAESPTRFTRFRCRPA